MKRSFKKKYESDIMTKHDFLKDHCITISSELVLLLLIVSVNNFIVMSGQSILTSTMGCLKCLAQGYYPGEVGNEPRTSWSGVLYTTTRARGYSCSAQLRL